MKNKWKLLLVAVIAIALVAVVVLLLGTTRTSYAANGESGVLFSDYFSSNAAKPDWKVGFNETLVSPGTVENSLQLSGSGLVPCAAMLDKALPNQFDLFFTMDTKERGGDSRDPGVFFCVDGDYNQRYQLLISDKKLVLRYNGTQEVAVKKAMLQNADRSYYLCDSSKRGQKYAFNICTTKDISAIIDET